MKFDKNCMIIVAFFLVAFIITLIVLFSVKFNGDNTMENFTSPIPQVHKLKTKEIKEIKRNYNPLYTSPDSEENGYIHYSQPSGDIDAQDYGHSGQGTSGGWLPLQGNGAQIMMAHSSKSNHSIPTFEKGEIGGQDNYTGKKFTTWLNGYNNFGGMPKDEYSNSYLIDGANQRVTNAGQNGPLKCNDGWPTTKKNSNGYCTISNDALVQCDHKECALRFLKSKMEPRWKKV